MYLNTQPQNDIDRGREAMKYFHNRSCQYSGYKIPFDALLNQVGGKHVSIFLDGLGTAITAINLPSDKVQAAMERLADQGRGMVPKNPNVFFKALGDQGQMIDWVEATGFALKESGKVILDAAVDVGQSVGTTLKGLTAILPILVIGGVIYIATQKIRKVA